MTSERAQILQGFRKLTVAQVEAKRKELKFRLELLSICTMYPFSPGYMFRKLHRPAKRKAENRAQFLALTRKYLEKEILVVSQAEAIKRLHGLELNASTLEEALDWEPCDPKQWFKCKLILSPKGHKLRNWLIDRYVKIEDWLVQAKELSKAELIARSPGWQKHKARVQRKAFKAPDRLPISCARRTKPSASSASAGPG